MVFKYTKNKPLLNNTENMWATKYTQAQIKELKKNQYVKDCTQKYITFTDAFKMKVLKWEKEWIYHRQTFYDCGFPEYVWDTSLVPRIVWSWRFKLKNKWLTWLIWTKKWRKKWEKIDIDKMSPEEKIRYLEAENAYLRQLHKTAYWHSP